MCIWTEWCGRWRVPTCLSSGWIAEAAEWPKTSRDGAKPGSFCWIMETAGWPKTFRGWAASCSYSWRTKGCRPYEDPAFRHSLGPMNVGCPNCHALHFPSEKLVNSSNIHPKFVICCLQGQIQLPSISHLPPLLHQLLISSTPHTWKFRDSIRQYNSAFTFTSVAMEQTPSRVFLEATGITCSSIARLLPIHLQKYEYYLLISVCLVFVDLEP